MPAQAGIQLIKLIWVPAFRGDERKRIRLYAVFISSPAAPPRKHMWSVAPDGGSLRRTPMCCGRCPLRSTTCSTSSCWPSGSASSPCRSATPMRANGS